MHSRLKGSSMTSSGAESFERLVLDTSAYSHFRHGHSEVLDLLAVAEIVFLPTIVLGELEAAFELGSRPKENRVALREFLAEPSVVSAPVSESVARRYGQLFAQLRRAGTPIPVNDVWIAATALERRGHLLTFDSDFGRIAGLSCTLLEA